MSFVPRLQHESLNHLQVLSAWNVAPPPSLESKIWTDPALDARAKELFPDPAILCHLASSQQKKEWPLTHWAALYKLATAAGIQLIFSTGIGAREESLLNDFKKLAPTASVLPPVPDLALYLAVLQRARAFISGDTGPLHFAAGVGVPTLALFGPSSAVRWAPLGPCHKFLTGSNCSCGAVSVCQSANHCLAAILPGQVLGELQSLPIPAAGHNI